MEEQQQDTGPGTAPTEERRALRRAPSSGVLTGVCAGLGEYTRVDPVVWRSAFVVTAMSGGVGLWLYLAAWALMRDEEGGPALAEQFLDRRLRPEAVLALLGAGLTAFALLTLIGGPGWGTLVLAVPLLLGLMTARARGVDLAQTARDLPGWLREDEPAPAAPEREPEPAYYDPAVPWSTTGGGPVDMRLVAEAATGEPADAGPPAPPEPRYQKPARRRRGLSLATAALALIGAAAVTAVAVAGEPSAAVFVGEGAGTVFLGSTIVIIGTVYLLGAWFGDPRGLAVLGVLAVLLTMASVMTDLTDVRFTRTDWQPTTVADAESPHHMTGGHAVLDLTEVPYQDLDPDERVTVDASVGFGLLEVRVPETAVTEVNGEVFLGGVTLADEAAEGGVRINVRETLEPAAETTDDSADDSTDDTTDNTGPGVEGEETSDPPNLVLNLRSHAGDVRVNHA